MFVKLRRTSITSTRGNEITFQVECPSVNIASEVAEKEENFAQGMPSVTLVEKSEVHDLLVKIDVEVKIDLITPWYFFLATPCFFPTTSVTNGVDRDIFVTYSPLSQTQILSGQSCFFGMNCASYTPKVGQTQAFELVKTTTADIQMQWVARDGLATFLLPTASAANRCSSRAIVMAFWEAVTAEDLKTIGENKHLREKLVSSTVLQVSVGQSILLSPK
jgi:hypothetical protein